MSMGGARPYAVALALAIVAGGSLVAWRRMRAPRIPVPADIVQLNDGLVEMIEHYGQLVRQAPREADRHATLGLVYEANSLWPEARQAYSNAGRLDPREPMWAYHAALAAQRAGDIDGALEMLRDSADRFPDFAPLQHRYGEALIEVDALDQARAAFERAIDAAPQAPEPYAGLGEVRLLQGDDAGAAEALQAALERDPQYRAARYLLGLAYQGLGRIEEAQRELEAGVNAVKRAMHDTWMSRTPEFKLAGASERAEALLGAGQPAQAARVLEQELARWPEEVHLLVNLGAAYGQLGRLDQAARVLERARDLGEGRFEVHVNLSEVYGRLGRLPEALAEADRAIQLDPKNARGHAQRGRVLRRAERPQEAYASLLEAVRLDGTDPRTREELAEVCFGLGLHGAARGHFEALAAMLPGAWQPRVRLALVCLEAGDTEGARAALEAARSLAPGEPTVVALTRQLAQLEED